MKALLALICLALIAGCDSTGKPTITPEQAAAYAAAGHSIIHDAAQDAKDVASTVEVIKHKK